MKKLLEQLFKFGLVGGLCFVIDYGLMILLTEVCGILYLISSGISFTVSVIVNYLLSMHFVFEPKQDSGKINEFIMFIALSVIGLGINQLLMWIMVDHMGIFYMISKIAVTFIVMVYNFITRKLLLEERGRSS